MLYIVGCAQEGVGRCTTCDPVRLELTDKQQHLAPAFTIVNMLLPSVKVCRYGVLTLTVKHILVDEGLVIHDVG